MIEPFSVDQVAEGTISYGLSSYGYDLRLADEFKIFSPPPLQVIDPKSIPPEYYRDCRAPTCDIPPNGYILAELSNTSAYPGTSLLYAWGNPHMPAPAS